MMKSIVWAHVVTAAVVLTLCMLLAGAWTFSMYAGSLDFISNTDPSAVSHLGHIARVGIGLLIGSVVPLALAVIALILALRARRQRS